MNEIKDQPFKRLAEDIGDQYLMTEMGLLKDATPEELFHYLGAQLYYGTSTSSSPSFKAIVIVSERLEALGYNADTLKEDARKAYMASIDERAMKAWRKDHPDQS